MDSFDAGFKLEGESAGELVPYDPDARDARLEEIVSKLVQLHEKVRDLKDGIKAIEQAAEAQRYSKPALKRVVARLGQNFVLPMLMTEDERLAADREQRAYEDMRRKLGDWRETPLGAASES